MSNQEKLPAKPEERVFRLFLGLLIFSALGSILSKLTGLNPGPIAPISALLTLACGTAAVVLCYRRVGPLWAVGVVLLIGATSEVVGLYTGWPFGVYEYTNKWWPVVALPGGQAFPIQLPFAWLMVTGSAWALARRFVSQPIAVAILAGFFAAILDWPMEAVMVGPLGYWTWVHPAQPFGAPVQNFFGWWLVSGLGALVLNLALSRNEKPPAAMHRTAGAFALFLAVLAVLHGLYLACGVLVVVGAFFWWRLPGRAENS